MKTLKAFLCNVIFRLYLAATREIYSYIRSNHKCNTFSNNANFDMLTEMTENMLIKHLMKEFLVEVDKGSPML